MLFRKLRHICILLPFLAGCTGKSLVFNQSLVQPRLKEKPAMYISCIKCVCILDELNNLYRIDPGLLKRFDIYADSACLPEAAFLPLVQYCPQSLLDSIQEDNYNVILFRRLGNGVKGTLVESKDSKELKKILEKFSGYSLN